MTAVQLIIGSRGSALAMAQARLVRDALDSAGQASRILIIETEGDRRAPDTAWGEGAFVSAIERALLEGRIDVAVHSAKDIPTDETPRLRIVAYLPRADARDALVVPSGAAGRLLADLPSRARVGTDSPRRTGFVLACRPDLVVHPLHGNVDTRLRRLDEGQTDALILACAGLDRLGRGDLIAERLEPEVVPPAPGQGAIAVQIRSDDERLLALASALDDRRTRSEVEAERAFLAASGGGCRAPIGALASVVGDELHLLGGHANPDGSRVVFGRREGLASGAQELGRALAAELGSVRASAGTAHARSTPRRILVTRPAAQAGDLVSALRDAGLDPLPVPAIEVELEPPGGAADRAARVLHAYHWVVVTSANGARAIIDAAKRASSELRGPSWAAIGASTRAVLERDGIEVRFQPSQASSRALAAELPVVAGDQVLLIRGDLARQELAATLRRRGAEVDDVVAYRTREAPATSRPLLRGAFTDGPIAAAVFTSGSAVRGLVSLGRAESIDVHSVPAICIGPETADEARAAGFHILAVAPDPSATALAEATATALAPQTQEAS